MAITASVLPLLLERVGGVWPDNQNNMDLVPNIVTLQAIQENTTSRIDTIISNEKDRDVKVTWVKACPPTPTDCADSCTFAGEEASTDSKTYALTQCKQTEFKVDIDGWYANEFEATDATARLLLSHFTAHADLAAEYALAVINANLTTNAYTNGGNWTAGTTTDIPSDQWTTALFGGLQRAAIKNKLEMPYLLSGENLHQEFFMAKTSQGNGEGKGDANRIGTMKAYFDLFNVDDVNDPDYITYMIARGVLAFASKGYYDTRPEKVEGRDAHTRVTIPNQFFPQLLHDVQITTSCSGGHTYEHYKIKTKYDVFVNPLGCTSTRTGILKFRKEAGI